MGNSRIAEIWYKDAAYGAYNGVSLTQITLAQDITEEDSRSEFPEMDRATILNGTALGQRTYSVTFGYHYATGTDAVYSELLTAYTTDATLNFAVCDGPKATSGTKIVWIEGIILSMPIVAPLEGTFGLSIKVGLAVGANIEDFAVT